MNHHGNSTIESVGYYLPPQEVKTAHILAETKPEKFGIAENFIESWVGIAKVRHSSSEQLPSDLATYAAQQALEKTDINKDYIDLIIFCGIEGDYTEPSTAHVIQHKLGLKSAICFDVKNACLGFMSGLQIADAMIASGAIRYALVCTGEMVNRVMGEVINALKNADNKSDYLKKLGYLTVGDAGGAMLLGRKQSSGILNFNVNSAGEHSSLCYYRCDHGSIFSGEMSMGKICAVTKKAHQKAYASGMEKLDWVPSEIDCLISHQVGERPFEILSSLCDVSMKKMTRTFDYLGNITTATFPVNMGVAMDKGEIKSGDKVYAAMSGSGISVCHAGLIL